MMMNRGKRGIVLNLKNPSRSVTALREMIRSADVVLENYRKGTMEKLGLGYEDLKCREPRADLWFYLRLRAHGAICRPRRVRSGGARHVRADVGDGRGAWPAALQGRPADLRHHGRDPAGHGRLLRP